MNKAIDYGKSHGKDLDQQVDAALDRLLVGFGSEILKIVLGKVSTEVDARFSFDTETSVGKALHIIDVGIRQPTLVMAKGADLVCSCTRSLASAKNEY